MAKTRERMTPEEWEQRKAAMRVYRARHVEKLKSTEEGRQRLLAKDREKAKRKYDRYKIRRPELLRERWRRKDQRNIAKQPPKPPRLPIAANAYVIAAPSVWRDTLLELSRLTPMLDVHDEIVSEASLYVVEGMQPKEAVAKAKTKVMREQNRYRYNKPIEDCYWL